MKEIAKTFIGWHRNGFQLFWHRKCQSGRPRIPPDLQRLIRQGLLPMAYGRQFIQPSPIRSDRPLTQLVNSSPKSLSRRTARGCGAGLELGPPPWAN